MKLIYISGFPRSGTTYIHSWLLRSPSCSGVYEEQGLDVIWRTTKLLEGVHYDEVTNWLWKLFPDNESLTPEEQKRILMIKQVHWMGIFVWKNMKALGVKYLDGWCNAKRRFWHSCYAIKTPTFELAPDWPEEYVKRSKLFSDYRVICMIRDPEEVYYSGQKHFPHWRGIKRDVFIKNWLRMYSSIIEKPSKWIMINHADLINSKKRQKLLKAIAKWLKIIYIPPEPFKVTSLSPERWLNLEQRNEVEKIFNSEKIFRV